MNIAFIPVRCGSKSIPLKNIKIFCGKPLVYWSVKAAEESKIIDKIVVATDCEDIKKVVDSFDFKKVEVFIRSKKNATDFSPTEDVVLEYIHFQKSKLQDHDYLFLIQATSPYISGFDLNTAFKQLLSEKGDSLVTCTRTKRFFWKDNGRPINYKYQERPRRQDFKGTYVENGSFYINSIGNFLLYKNRLSGSISIYEMNELTLIEIDEPEDWEIAEANMRKFLSLDKSKKKLKLFLSDIDGTLTDAGMYYDELGNEMKKFNTRDGMGFKLIKDKDVKVGLITSEDKKINTRRAKKLKVDFLFQGLAGKSKLQAVEKICEREKISLKNVAYIGDDINCLDLLSSVAFKACPFDAVSEIRNIPGIFISSKKGGEGAVRDFIDHLILNEA